MDNKIVLITDITTKIGESVYNVLYNETDYEIVALSGSEKKIDNKFVKAQNLSVLDLKEIKKLCYDLKPSVIIHTSEMTNLDECEKDKKLAWDLNVASTEHLASISRVIDSHLICYSTDFVFDDLKGPYTEEDKPNPINYFGKTKHAMENSCLYNLNQATVIRVCEPYGYSEFGNLDFIYNSIVELETGQEIFAVTDRFFNPVYVDDAAIATMKIIDKKRYGVFHCGGVDWLSEYEITLAIASILNLDKNLIKQIKPVKINNKLPRPRKNGLVTLKTETDLDMKFSSLESGILSIRFHITNINQFVKFTGRYNESK